MAVAPGALSRANGDELWDAIAERGSIAPRFELVSCPHHFKPGTIHLTSDGQ